MKGGRSSVGRTSGLQPEGRRFDPARLHQCSKSFARVVELVDTRDLKSLDSNVMPVQVRLRVPIIC